MTLEESIIATALPGISYHACPGGWKAIICRPIDGRPARVTYHKPVLPCDYQAALRYLNA
jgi:hypothetical protein